MEKAIHSALDSPHLYMLFHGLTPFNLARKKGSFLLIVQVE
ncbi:hypothetical protein HMPREF0083_02887 [Aneurinibacillus aneurinilyticus ATCC 12856]|uniref:Uncharacterized protein n=1 Tax=Aneurinibacillus aneurinilyticus ATCC 12856 TaxID=649747 RepID=U1X234_ANEAE|nr:hypothetical protein HMPREF0083_02887 [Aneurinibacillus aneurinilyticus ATCC 12856]